MPPSVWPALVTMRISHGYYGRLSPIIKVPAGSLSLEAHRGTTVVGEMGTGKTFIAAAAHMAGFRRILVLCPPHLVPKWKREVEMTVLGARAVIVKSITDLERLRLSVGSGPLFAVMSREKAKLSYTGSQTRSCTPPLRIRITTSRPYHMRLLRLYLFRNGIRAFSHLIGLRHSACPCCLHAATSFSTFEGSPYRWTCRGVFARLSIGVNMGWESRGGEVCGTRGLDGTGNSKRHTLLDIITIALCGISCGADSWVDIELFGKCKEDWFRTFLELPNGIPSHDTFGDVFARLDPEQFQRCFMEWVQAVAQVTQGEVVAIDGKTVRRSHDRTLGKKPIHMVNVWASSNGLALGQTKVDEKSNEITAIPKLLQLLELSGCIVTIDAMGC